VVTEVALYGRISPQVYYHASMQMKLSEENNNIKKYYLQLTPGLIYVNYTLIHSYCMTIRLKFKCLNRSVLHHAVVLI